MLLGYGLSALTKPLFPLASGVGLVLAARFVDRIGKGIRGAPRDALIADITPQATRGAAYGLRQSMDTVGAFAGPALALLIMGARVSSVDTNVLVRLLAADDAKQGTQARALMVRAARTGESLFVPLTVVLELEWVLRSRYDYPKEQVLTTLSSLLETRELVFQDEAAVEHALHFYRRSRVDFAECLHLGCAASAGRLPLITFDRAVARVQRARLMGSSN